MINLGSLNLSDMKIGTSSVLSGYVGTDLVYPVRQPDYIANAPDSMSGSPINVWFDTGVMPTKTMCMEVKAANVNFAPNVNQQVIGATNAGSAEHFGFLFPRNSTYHIAYVRYNGAFAQSDSADYTVPNKPYVCTMWLSGTTRLVLDIDGTQLTGTVNSRVSAPNFSLWLFARDLAGTVGTSTRCYGGAKIYYVKFYDEYGGNLLYHFVPWIDNGEACFKDLVNGTIIHNLGTDTPVYGYD